jgi:hypothetical protein
MNYKFKTLKGKEIDLSIDFIKKHVPFWNANKIFIADDITESSKLDPRTKYSREYQYTRILLDKDRDISACAAFSDGLSSNALHQSIFNHKQVYVANGFEQTKETWKKTQNEDIEITDILGNKGKIKAWVWYEYLTPSERETVVFSRDIGSEEEREELSKKLMDKYGPDEDFIIYRDVEAKGTVEGFISITRIKVKDIKLMTGSLSKTDWKAFSPTVANRVRYSSFYKTTLKPRYVAIDHKGFDENQVYEYMLDPNNRVEFEDYIKNTDAEISGNYMSNGMRKDVYYEILKYGLIDKMVTKNIKEFAQELTDASLKLSNYNPGTLVYCAELQRAILHTGVDIFNVDLTTTYDLTNMLKVSKEDIEFFEAFQADLAETEVPVKQLIDMKTMKFTPFEVGIFEFGDFYILVTPDLQSKAYHKLMLSEDENFLNQFFNIIETQMKPFLEKQKQGLVDVAAKTAVAAPLASKVFETVMSDAVEVSKRIAVSKVMNIISNTIVENLKQKHKKNNAMIEATIKFLSSKEGKSVLMVTAGSILPTIKPILGTKYEGVIDSISAELRVSGETELASGLVDLLGESLSKAFSNLDLFTDGQEKLRVEVTPQLQTSKTPVLDFIQTMEQETAKINGTKIL